VVSIKLYPSEYFDNANTVHEVKALKSESNEWTSPKKKKNKSPNYVPKSPQMPAPKK